MEKRAVSSKNLISNFILNDITKQYGDIISVTKSDIALTNNVFFIDTITSKIVLKVFSLLGEGIIDNSSNFKLMNYFSNLKITPKCLTFRNDYCILEFMEGTPLQADKLNSTSIANLTNVMKKIHACDLDIAKRDLRQTFNDYIARIPDKLLNLPLIKEVILKSEILFDILSKFKKNLVVCHHDININNFIQKGDDIFILDFEYTTINDLYTDLAPIYSMIGEKNFNIFTQYYELEINQSKLQSYLLVSELLSCLWYFMMLSSPKASDFDYLQEGTVFAKAFLKNIRNLK